MTYKENVRSWLYALWSLFLKGLLTILPIALTIGILNFSFRVLKNWLAPIYQLEPEWLKAIPFSEFFLTFLFIISIGSILNTFMLATIWSTAERLFAKIPLVRPIYAGIKQLVEAFNPHDNKSFKHVVLIQFPREGIFSIGFMTSEASPDLSPDLQRVYYNVFIPTTPNPTAGFFLIIPKENVQITNLTRQEAMALIISGGIITPERFKDNQQN